MIYRFVLPIISISLFIGTIPFDIKPTTTFLIIIRVLFCAWLCAVYIRLSNIENYSIYPNIKWQKADVGPQGKIFYRFGAVFWGIGIYIVTVWAVKTFVPSLASHRYWISLVNGIIVFLPIWKYYWVQKL
jgi:hypothetical protein